MKAPMSNSFKVTGSNQQISFRPQSGRPGEEQKSHLQQPSGVVSSHSFSNYQRQGAPPNPNTRTVAQFEQLISPSSVSAKSSTSFNDYKNRQVAQPSPNAQHNMSSSYSYKFAQQQAAQQNQRQQQMHETLDKGRESWEQRPDLQYQATGKDLRTTPSIEERPERSYFQTSIETNTGGYRSQMNRSPLGVPGLSSLGGVNSQAYRDEQANSSNSSRYTNANIVGTNIRNLNPQANRLLPHHNDYYLSNENTQRNHGSQEEFTRREDDVQSEQLMDQAATASQVDMEHIIMNLHSKMKNLESKYIDLANFYKKELVSKKGLSHYSPIRAPGDQSRFKQSRDRSPNHIQQSDLDHNAESSIIQELLAEKNDLEKELATMIQIQSKQQDSEAQFQERLELIERENYELKQLAFQGKGEAGSAPSSSHSQLQARKSQSQFEEAQGQISQVLNQFEVEFLDFINQNYNKFTEKDVVSMFGNLKHQMSILVAQYRQQLFAPSQQPLQKAQNDDSALYMQLEQERQQLVEQHKNDLSSFELTHEYQIQNIKKSVFDLKSRQEMTKLDLKKLGLNLNNLTKSASELQAQYGGTPDTTKKYQNVNMSSHGFQERSHSQNKRATLDPRSFNSFNQISPISPNNQGVPLRIVQDIQGYIQAINQSFNDVHHKVMSGDKDLKNLSQIEKDNINNFEQLKDNLKLFVQGLDKLKLENNESSISQYNTITNFTEEDQIDSAAKHIHKLKVVNDKLFKEQQSFTEKYNQLKLENNSLKTEIDKLTRVSPHKQVNAFDYSGGSDQKQRRASSIGQQYLNQQKESIDASQQQDFKLLQQKLNLVQQDNENLKRSIKTLNRYIDDKNVDIERLNNELTRMTNKSSRGPEAAEKIQFYQDYADQQIEKLRQLIKFAQKFLYSMKKLQKAVHRKENNVQQEKLEFETTRKDLESYIKELKKEIDQLVEQQVQPPPSQQAQPQPSPSYHNDNQNASKSQRAETIYQKTIKSKPQNSSLTRPQVSLSQRAHENENFKRQSLTQVSYPNNKSFNVNNPYSISNSMTAAHLQEGEAQQSKDISPLGKKGMFQSIDPSERKSSYAAYGNNNAGDQSPSGVSASAFNLRQQQPSRGDTIDTPSASTLQIQSMKHDISVLQSEIVEVRNERDYVKNQLKEAEKEKVQMNNERLLSQSTIDKERSKHEASKAQTSSLEAEKKELLAQIEQGADHQECQNEIGELQVQNRRLQDDFRAIEKMSQEYKRTLQFLEESAEVAKQTILDQKESLVTQEIQLDELRSKFSIASQEAKLSSSSIKELRVKLTAQIQTNNDKMEDQFEQISDNLDQNLQRVDQLDNQLVILKKDAFKKSAKNPQMESIISSFQSQLQEITSQAEAKAKQQQNLEQELLGKDKALIDLQLKVKSEVEKVKRELNAENQSQLAQLEQELENQHLEALQELNSKHQKSLLDNEQQMKKARESLTETIKVKESQLRSLEESQQALERDLQQSQAHLQQQIEQLKQKLQKSEAELKKKESGDSVQLQSKEGQIRELVQTIEGFEETISSQNIQLIQLQAQVNKEKEGYQKQVLSKNQEIEGLKQQLEELNNDYNQQLQELNDANEEELAVKEKEILEIKQQLQKDKTAYEKALRDKDVDLTSLEQEKEQLECELQDELQRVSYESKIQVTEIEEKVKKLQKQVTQNEKEILQKEQNLEEMRLENEQLQEQIKDQINQLSKESSNMIGNKDQEILLLKQKVQGIEKSNREMKSQFDLIFQEKSQLEIENLESLQKIKQDHETLVHSKDQGQLQLQQKLNNTEKQLTNSQQKLTQIQEDKDELEMQHQSDIDQLNQLSESKLAQKTKDLQLLQAKVASLEQDLQVKGDQLIQARSDLSQLEQNLENEIEEAGAEKDRLAIQSQKAEHKLKTKIIDLEGQVSSLQQQLQTLGTQNSSQLAQLEQDFQQQIQQQQSENSNMTHQLQEAKASSEKLIRHKDQEIESLKEEKSQLEAELQEQLDEVHQEKGALLSSKEQETHQLKSQLQNITKQLKQKELDVEDLNQELELEKQNHLETELQSEEAKAQAIKQVQGVEEKLAKANSERNGVEKEKQLKQAEIQKLNEKIEALTYESQESIQAIQDRLQNSTQVKDKEITAKNDEIKQLKQQSQEVVKTLREQLKAKDDIMEQLQANGDSHKTFMQTELSQYKQQVASSTAQVKELREEVSEKAAYIEELEQQINDSENTIEDLKLEIESTKQQVEDITVKNKQMMKENHQLLQQKNSEHMDLDETRQQNNKLEEELHEAKEEIEQLQQQIQDQTSEQQFITQARDNLQTQLTNLEAQSREKGETDSQKKEQLQGKIDQVQNELSKAKAEVESVQQKMENMAEDSENKEKEMQRVVKQNEHAQNELKHKVTSLESDIQSLNKQHANDLQSLEQQLKQVQGERDKSMQQLKDMVNQTTVEKQSVESQLQKQLTDTLSQLQQKEKDLLASQKEIQTSQHQNQTLAHQIDGLEDKIIQVESDNQSYQEALAEAEETREKHQSTLENNRNLIQMLKNELQKSIDKVKALEQGQQKAAQDGDMKKQLEQMREDNEEKMMDLQMRIDDQESELKIKNELVEEANRVIEEFNDEKHELKAKFKHLMQIYEDVEEESSYKEDDEVNLEACFDLLEQVLSKHQQKVDMKFTQIEEASALTERQLQEKERELTALQMKMGEVQCELMNATNKCENNDIEMRKQMDTAQRKIENYKEKLIEKQKHINQLEGDKKKEVSETSSIKDNIELLQKLQKAEQELQSYRQAEAKKVQLVDSTLHQDQSVKVDMQRLAQIEDQLQSLRKQIFQAKDQVISSLSETFSKKLKDIKDTFINEKILQQKLKEIKSEDLNQDLNSQIKLLRVVHINTSKVVIARLISSNELVVLDESKLSPTALQFLHSFVNGDPVAQATDNLNLNSKQQQIVDQLLSQIKEARQDRQELEQELLQYKHKFLASGPDDLKEMRLVELEDDVGHLTSENLELRTKMKDLSSQNSELRLRVIELNDMLADLVKSGSTGDSEGDKLLKLVEENQALQRQIQNLKKRSMSMTNDEKKQMENSFLADIHVQGGNDNKVRGGQGGGVDGEDEDDNDNPNFFDQSSLINVIEDIGGATPRKSVASMQKTIEKLVTELDEAKSKLKNMTAEVQINQQQQQQTFTKEEQSVIDHIKGTLIQFLKNCPLTDKNNEELLAIVFSMMEFSKAEIEEVQQYRKRTRAGSVNPSGGGGTSNSSARHPSEPDEETKSQVDKMKKSLFGGMFKKKDSSSTNRQKEEKSNSRIMSASPIRPIKR